MEPENDQIYDLIAKSFSGELSDEELVYLNNWKAADNSNLLEYNDFKEIWKSSNRLAMPSPLDLTKLLVSTRNKAGIDRRLIRWFPVFTQIAAVLIFSLLFSSLYNLYLTPKHLEKLESPVYQQVKASFGIKSRVELSDGTVVYLNSGSSLRFPNSFKSMKNRIVELSGEGHFSVIENSEQPFIVDIQNMQIKVIGTTFNVDAYSDNTAFTIALVEGSIQLQQKNGDEIKDVLEMKPNQVAFYNQSENKLQLTSEDDLSKYTAWTDGKIVFSDDPVQTVIQKLEKWYNVDIEIADKSMERYRFTGTFIDEPLEQVLNIINLTSQMKYQIIPARKLSDNSYSKRKIILKSK